jgi:hypothetical protein
MFPKRTLKKLVLLAISLIVIVPCLAQGVTNHLYAKIGGNYSYVERGPVWAEGNPSRAGLTAGLEYELTYGCWGGAIGAMFSMQGEKKGYWADGNNMFVFPATLNYHFNKIPLILKAGFQYGRGKSLDDWSIPMGVAWHFNRFSIEAMYKQGISTKNHRTYDTYPEPIYGEHIPGKSKSGKSRTFTITIGYKLPIW